MTNNLPSHPPARPRSALPRATTPVRDRDPQAQAPTASRMRLQQYIVTQQAPCPYLPGLMEQKLVTRLDMGTPEAYEQLHQAGFRRSHDMAYRPVCPTCQKCKSLRINIEAFKPNRTQRKLLRKHKALRRIVSETGPTLESYQLFNRYTHSRHSDGEMSGMTPDEFASMLLETSVDTHLIEWHLPDQPKGETLVAACLTDVTQDGLSMVYSFFDTSVPANSFGTFMILSVLEVCQLLALPYLYLGYWVEGSRSMGYKSTFKAVEVYDEQGWFSL